MSALISALQRVAALSGGRGAAAAPSLLQDRSHMGRPYKAQHSAEAMLAAIASFVFVGDAFAVVVSSGGGV